jgi:glutathione S-transferase
MTLRLTGRSSSHFTRIVQMFAHELELPFEFEPVHHLMHLDPDVYGGHPGLKIPTLHVDGAPVYGTENICRKLVERAGRADIVLFEHVRTDLARNAQELTWHSMSAQVQLVLGTVFAKPADDDRFFVKLRASLTGSLHWLDAHLDDALAELPPRDFSLFEVALFCLVEHLAFRPTLPPLELPRLRRFVSDFGARPSAQRTPYRSDR